MEPNSRYGYSSDEDEKHSKKLKRKKDFIVNDGTFNISKYQNSNTLNKGKYDEKPKVKKIETTLLTKDFAKKPVMVKRSQKYSDKSESDLRKSLSNKISHLHKKQKSLQVDKGYKLSSMQSEGFSDYINNDDKAHYVSIESPQHSENEIDHTSQNNKDQGYYRLIGSDEENPDINELKAFVAQTDNVSEFNDLNNDLSTDNVPNEIEKANHQNLNSYYEDALNFDYYFPAYQGCRSVEEYQCLNRIEEGTYGVVYRAKNKKSDQVVALKRLKMEKEKEGFPITSLREINTLMKAHHPNVVSILEIVVGSNMDKIYIVMEFIEHDLKSLMETMKQPFLIGEVKTLLLQLLRGVHHLHDNWILHRDIKASNVLLSHSGILKLGDFGLAREYGSPLKPYTPVVVTLWYRAPELLLGAGRYSTPIDLWSVGCLMGELLTLRPLFQGKSEVDQLNKIYKDLGTPNEVVWPGYSNLPMVKKINFVTYPHNNIRKRFNNSFMSDTGFDLLAKLLTYDPTDRVSAEGGINHPFFTESPLPVNPSLLPTFPAKSEQYQSALHTTKHSPKPPSGGGQYQSLMKSEMNIPGAEEHYAAVRLNIADLKLKAQRLAASTTTTSSQFKLNANTNFLANQPAGSAFDASTASLSEILSKSQQSQDQPLDFGATYGQFSPPISNMSAPKYNTNSVNIETSSTTKTIAQTNQTSTATKNLEKPEIIPPDVMDVDLPPAPPRHYHKKVYIDPDKASAYLFKSMSVGDPNPSPPHRTHSGNSSKHNQNSNANSGNTTKQQQHHRAKEAPKRGPPGDREHRKQRHHHRNVSSPNSSTTTHKHSKHKHARDGS